jgi:hypothetical protein
VAGDDVTEPQVSVAAAVIEAYLADLATRLIGPAAARAAILDELHDGLLNAVETHRGRGLAPIAAAEAAVNEFGPADLLSAAFRPEMAGAQARRVGLGFLLTGPLVGILWVVAMASPIPPWRHAPSGVWVGTPLLGMAVVMGILASLLAVNAPGRLFRWLAARPTVGPLAAAATGVSAAVADLTALGMLAVQAITVPGSLAWPLAAAAILASLTRLALTRRVVPICLAARA